MSHKRACVQTFKNSPGLRGPDRGLSNKHNANPPRQDNNKHNGPRGIALKRPRKIWQLKLKWGK